MTTTLPAGGPASAEDRDRLDAFLAARRRGVDWLLARLNPDGALGDPAEGYKYYRALWTFGRPARSRPATRRRLVSPQPAPAPTAGSAARSAPSSTAGRTATRR